MIGQLWFHLETMIAACPHARRRCIGGRSFKDLVGCAPARNIPGLGNADRQYLYADGRRYYDRSDLRILVSHVDPPSAWELAVESALKHVGA